MIPANILILDRLPMTPVGKVDRAALAALPEDDSAQSDDDAFAEPEGDVERILAGIWKELLNLDKVSATANFFEIGGNSLAVIMAHIKTYPYDWNLSAQDFYQYQTIRQLARRIGSGRAVISTKESSDAHLEALKIDIGKLRSALPEQSAAGPMKSVLLTGGTGFLGMHLLQEILNTTDAVVYCLIRSANGKAAVERLAHVLNFYFGKKYHRLIGIRILPVQGNISSPNLGMTGKMYDKLVGIVDTVFHCAANVRHYGQYEEFKKVNVDGTAQIIDFCMKAGAVMNHISTASIAGGFAPDSKDRDFSEKDLYIGQNYSENVYIRSKFEAEVLVFKAMEAGLRARVIRIGNLTGRTTDGLFQQNIDENAFYGRIRSFIKIGAVPRSVAKIGIELSPVDLTGRAVLQLCMRPKTLQRALHVLNSKTMAVEKYIGILNRMGYAIEIIDEDKFNSRIEKIIADKDGYKILQSILADAGDSAQNKDRGRITVRSGETDAQLAAAGFAWPDDQDAYVEKIMKYVAVKTDFLDR
jgi:thioester reductase-like protein